MAFNIKPQSKKTGEILVQRGYEVIHVVNLKDKTLLQNLLAKKIDLEASCGGNGTCGTCKVKVIEGAENLTGPTELEIEFRADRGFGADERLSCQAHCDGPVRLSIPQKKD
ncbi:MAG: 2Fe-2S iron-sulfur cluster-binding protein [Bdellovibrionota bacterium]